MTPRNENFYEYREGSPHYLMAFYIVEERTYRPEQEDEWMAHSLQLVREHGELAFPEVRYIVIVVQNRAMHTGRADWATSHTVGVVVPAKEVFGTRSPIECIRGAFRMRSPIADDHQPSDWAIMVAHARKGDEPPK